MYSLAHARLAPFFALLANWLLCLAHLPSATGAKLLVPLYAYPKDDNAWKPLVTTLTTHSALEAIVIVNPSSGPGEANSQPDEVYSTATAALKALPNAQVIGYVSTDYGKRAEAEVLADIATYAGWPEASRPAGIFFDESPTAADGIDTYTGYTDAAKKAFGEEACITVLNPGTPEVDTGYFGIATQVVTFEKAFSEFEPSALPSASPESQSLIIHSFPDGDATQLTKTLDELSGAGSIYITSLTVDYYKGFGTLLESVAAHLAGSGETGTPVQGAVKQESESVSADGTSTQTDTQTGTQTDTQTGTQTTTSAAESQTPSAGESAGSRMVRMRRRR